MSAERKRGTTYFHEGSQRWGYVIDVGKVNGRRKQERVQTFASRLQAEIALEQVRQRIQTREHVVSSRITVAEYFEDWLKALHFEVEPTTASSYTRNIHNHVISDRPGPYIGRIKLQDLDSPHLSALYSHLQESGRRDGSGGLSYRTVRYISTIVSKALSDAVAERRIAVNPATHAKKPSKKKARRPTPTTWTASQFREFLESIADDRIRPIVYVAAMTGMRRGEVMGLAWRDIDFGAERITVVRQLRSLTSTEYELANLKTDSSRRSISLDNGTVSVLREHRKAQLEEKLAIGPGYNDQDLVFPLPDGQPWNPNNFAKTFDRRVARSGLPRIRFHDLRHQWATLALEAGVHPKVVQERLGHSKISITLDTYSHVVKTLDAEAANTVANSIFKAQEHRH